MSKLVKTKAVVLKKLDYGDTSKIAIFFTENKGKITAIIKGAKSSKSKIGTSIDIFNNVEIIYSLKENREVQIITSADLISYHANLLTNLDKIKYSSAIIELVLNLTEENDPHPNLYKGLSKILKVIDGSNGSELELFLRFLLFLLKEIGYEIKFDFCSLCGKDLSIENEVLYNNELGFICKECSEDRIINYKLPQELFSALKCLSARNSKITVGNKALEKILIFFENFMKYNLPDFRGIKSLYMLR